MTITETPTRATLPTVERYWLPIPEQPVPEPVPVAFPVDAVRRDFPILHREIDGKPLIWLDNAATTQKPRQVIESLVEYYARYNSNVHRGAHSLAKEATEAHEGARATTAGFLGAGSPGEIVFVRGATEGVNLVANSWGQDNIHTGDEIVLTTMEHHANIVPWQMLADRKRARLRVVPIDGTGALDQDAFALLLNNNTKLVAFSHVSNVLGTIAPAAEMTALAHRYGAKVLVDGAQAVGHFPVNVQDIGADFYVMSGHKLFGPTGIGALFVKDDILREMSPWQGGGNMIDQVSFEKTTYADPPHRMEAGTANIADAIGLASAMDYLTGIGRESIEQYERFLTAYATRELSAIPGLSHIGTTPDKVGVLSVIIQGADPTALARHLDSDGIAVRSGHHCAQPAIAHFGLDNVLRPSLAFYNTVQEIDTLVASISEYLAGAPDGPTRG